MYVYNLPVACDYDSSILAQASTGDGAEIGWSIQKSGYVNCHSTGDGKAYVFYFWQFGNQSDCRESGGPLSSTYYPFSVRNNASDPGTWIFDFNGNVLDTKYLAFTGSQSVTNAERHNDGDPARGLFNGLQYRASLDNTWKAWNNSVCISVPPPNGDMNWNNQLLSATDVSVTMAPASC